MKFEFELVKGSHSVGEANYHMQFTPAYRRRVFEDELVKILTRDYMLAAAKAHGIMVAAIGFGPDHCHVFAVGCKNHSASHVAKLLKGFSSYMMRKHHKELFSDQLYGNKFWSGGYFYRTVGVVSTETVQRYVEDSQSKHWKMSTGTQKQLIEFAAI